MLCSLRQFLHLQTLVHRLRLYIVLYTGKYLSALNGVAFILVRLRGTTQTALLKKNRVKGCVSSTPPLHDCLQSLKHRRSVGSQAIFCLYLKGILLCWACLLHASSTAFLWPCCIELSTHFHMNPVLSSNAMQELYLQSFVPFSLVLCILFFRNPTTWTK